MKKTKIAKTLIPFIPEIKLAGDSIEKELLREIEKVAKQYNKEIDEFSARFQLFPEPIGGGHYLIAEVVFEKGELKKIDI